MTRVEDGARWCDLAYGMWRQLRAIREQGATLQEGWQALRGEALFTPEQIAAFDNIANTVKSAGNDLRDDGGDSVLTEEMGFSDRYPGWSRDE